MAVKVYMVHMKHMAENEYNLVGGPCTLVHARA